MSDTNFFDRKVASAALFAGLTVFTIGSILVEPSAPTILYQPFNTTSFFPHPKELQAFIAAVSAISALAFFSTAKRSQSLNNLLALVQFVLFAIAALLSTIVVMNLASAFSRPRYQGTTIYIVWHPSLFGIALQSCAIGCIVLVANLCIAAIKHRDHRNEMS